MKREIGLAAMMAMAASAHAQQVTIYGLIDTAAEHLTNVGSGGNGLTRIPGLTGSLPSRLGFRGTEALGSGMSAVFTLEQGFGPDTGSSNQGGRLFGRQSWVGLSGSWGTVSFGRQYTMLFWSQVDADILGPHMFGSASIDSYLPNARADNSIAYRGSFSGVTVGGTYSFGRDAVNAGPSPAGTNCAGENAADNQACRERSLMIKYDTPTWGAALATDQIKGGTGAFAGLTSSSLTDRRDSVTGWARFNSIKVGAGLISRRNEGSPAMRRSDLWYVGAAWNMAPNIVLDGAAFKLDYKNSSNSATLLAVRGTYNFSKRTAVYVTAGRIDNDGTLSLSLSNAAPGGNPVAGSGQSGFGAGLRHSF